MKSKKFKSVQFNNRKRQLTFIYKNKHKIRVHYGELGIKRNIKNAWVDKETGNRSIGLEFEDSTKDYIPYDQPLSISNDPEFILKTHIEIIIAHIKEELKQQGISKHYLAEYLKTSDNQIHRLLNPSILNKNLGQLYTIASLLGLKLEMKLKSAA
jgi:predicted XRE-type DNA-binding protein